MFFPERIKNIRKTDRVLEIGPGSLPYIRSDVYLEKKFDEKELFIQRGLTPKIKYKKPIFFYDGVDFPFDTKEFDYIICSHVLEHVEEYDLQHFISEVQRVGIKGYIEVPSLYYEYLFNFNVHKWLINYRDNKLIMLNKKKIQFNKIQDTYYLMLKYGIDNSNINFINEFKNLFIIGFEWKNEIEYDIVNTIDDLITTEDLKLNEDFFIEYKKRSTKSNSVMEMIKRYIK